MEARCRQQVIFLVGSFDRRGASGNQNARAYCNQNSGPSELHYRPLVVGLLDSPAEFNLFTTPSGIARMIARSTKSSRYAAFAISICPRKYRRKRGSQCQTTSEPVISRHEHEPPDVDGCALGSHA